MNAYHYYCSGGTIHSAPPPPEQIIIMRSYAYERISLLMKEIGRENLYHAAKDLVALLFRSIVIHFHFMCNQIRVFEAVEWL